MERCPPAPMSDQLQGQGIELQAQEDHMQSLPASQQCPVLEKPVVGAESLPEPGREWRPAPHSLSFRIQADSRRLTHGHASWPLFALFLLPGLAFLPSPGETNFTFKTQVNAHLGKISSAFPPQKSPFFIPKALKSSPVLAQAHSLQ